MHRYRKGQMFRPPTAAESAATADAVEAHRVRPGQPQDHSPVGQHIIVKVHEDGIPGREDDTIHYAMCKRCIQKVSGADKEIVPTDEQMPVHNILEAFILGDIYVATALTECGTRYVLPLNGKVIGKLDGALSQGGSATVSIWGGEGGEETDTNVDVVAYDWLLESGADDIASGKKVVVEWINGVPYVTAAECP